MPAMHFPLLFHSCSLPRLLSIAPSHRSMTERGRRVLHQMSDCISLSAGKARDVKGTILPPYFTCRVVTRISTHRKKSLFLHRCENCQQKKTTTKKNATAVEQGHTSFITCWAKWRSGANWNQGRCAWVWLSILQSIRGWSVGLFASHLALCELCECGCSPYVCVYGHVSFF